MQSINTHRSLEKALEILVSFMPHNQEMSTLELSGRLGFHPSTVNRLLHVLAKYGFVQQNRDTKKFVLGHAIVDLGSAVHQSLNGSLTKIAVSFIDDLRSRLGETVVLEIATPECTMIAHIAEGPGPIKIKETVGARHAYNAAAGAKAILAHSQPEFQERFLVQDLPGYTSRTITDPEKLKKQLREIRRRGFAFDDEERNAEIRAFGCPIFSHEKKPVAAVVVAGPAHRITWERRDEIIPALIETGGRISRQLYYKEDVKTPSRDVQASRSPGAERLRRKT